jgi:hypothetical protein
VEILAFYLALISGVGPPEQQKMGKDRYRQVLGLLAELAIEHSNEIQLILTTDTRDIPESLEPFAMEV